MSETTDQTTTEQLPGLELVPPGVAYQVQAAHDAQVNTLRALLAEARESVNLPTVQDVALSDIVAAAAAVTEAGRGTPGATDRRKYLERVLATVDGPLAVVVAAARWTDRYGRVGAVGALGSLEDAVRDLPAGEVRRA